MDVITGITQIGSLVDAAKSLINGLNSQEKSQPIPLSGAQAREKFLNALNAANARFIEVRDLDRNGSLTATELGGRKEVFSRLDTNQDGKLTLGELNEIAAKSPYLLNEVA